MRRVLIGALLLLSSASSTLAQDVEAYADKSSVLPGETIAFKVSLAEPGAELDGVPVVIHRVGAFGKLAASTVLRSVVDDVRFRNPPAEVWRVGCGWPTSFSWSVPSNLRSGLYTAQFGSGAKAASRVDFVVRGVASGARIVMQIPITTRQAYNRWGKGSLYGDADTGVVKSPIISFDRPDDGTDDSVFLAKELIRWAEGSDGHEPYAIDYITSIDLHAIPNVLAPYQLFVTAGHDEYWTRSMRDALDAFVRAGGNAAIFSGNTSYWQARLEPSGARPNRRLVSYKDNADEDPRQDATNTNKWFRNPINHPENSTFGLSFHDLKENPDGTPAAPLANALRGGGAMSSSNNERDVFPFQVVDASSWVFAGTGLANGRLFGQEIVGYETDALLFTHATNRPTGQDGSPNNFQILARAELAHWDIPGWAILGLFDYGGTVFNAGTVEWAAALTSDADFAKEVVGKKSETRDPVIVRITANLFDRLSAPRSTTQRNTMSVHEYYAPSPSGGTKFHFSTSPFVESGWEHNGRAFFAFRRPEPSGTVAVWQYHVAEGGGLRFHYSTDPNVSSGWTRGSVPAFYAYPAPGPDRVAVYEYYVRQNGGGMRFYYSRDPNVTSGWTRLGIAFYVPSSNGSP